MRTSEGKSPMRLEGVGNLGCLAAAKEPDVDNPALTDSA
jgi:hypothetical protein